MSKAIVPLAAAAVFAAGTIAHEATHAVTAWATGSTVKYISLVPPEVGYIAPTERADSLVRVSTVMLSVPLLVGYMLFLQEDIWSWRLLGLAAVVAYLPRSNSDWEPVAQLIK